MDRSGDLIREYTYHSRCTRARGDYNYYKNASLIILDSLRHALTLVNVNNSLDWKTVAFSHDIIIVSLIPYTFHIRVVEAAFKT